MKKTIVFFVSLALILSGLLTISAEVEVSRLSKVFFGYYEQDNDYYNGAEPIEWVVLKREGNQLLLLSLYALDVQPYNTVKESVLWEECSLRSWLNNDFYYEAFDDSEQQIIEWNMTQPSKNKISGRTDFISVPDNVFILDVDEISELVPSSTVGTNYRICVPTSYTESKLKNYNPRLGQAYYSTDKAGCTWWTRTPGRYSVSQSTIDRNGVSDLYGYLVEADREVAVRPAIWVDASYFDAGNASSGYSGSSSSSGSSGSWSSSGSSDSSGSSGSWSSWGSSGSWSSSGSSNSGSKSTASARSLGYRIMSGSAYASDYYTYNGKSITIDYRPENAFDGDSSTSWLMYANDYGYGLSGVTVGASWDAASYSVKGIKIRTGLQRRGQDSFVDNSRPAIIAVTVNGYTQNFSLSDTMGDQTLYFSTEVASSSGRFDLEVSVSSVFTGPINAGITNSDGGKYAVAIADIDLILTGY